MIPVLGARRAGAKHHGLRNLLVEFTTSDSADTMDSSVLSNSRPLIETYPSKST